MDPTATTSAAAAHGHLITATRRPLAPCRSPRPASDQRATFVDPTRSACSVLDFASVSAISSSSGSGVVSASSSDPDSGPGPGPGPGPPSCSGSGFGSGSGPAPALASAAVSGPQAASAPASLPASPGITHPYGVSDSQGSTTATLSEGILIVSHPSEDASASSTSSAPPPQSPSFASPCSSSTSSSVAPRGDVPTPSPPRLENLPSEMLTLVAGFLDVNDLLYLSRTCHRLRSFCLDPIIHIYRLRDARLTLSSLLASPFRPSLADLISRFIFQTNNTVISRRLARSLVSIRLSRRLAQRPSAESLVQRAVLPCECVPGMSPVLVSPALVAKRKAIEKERLKDSLRRWIACKWKGEVQEREEDARRYDEAHGVGRVWRLRRFWEKVSRGEVAAR